MNQLVLSARAKHIVMSRINKHFVKAIPLEKDDLRPAKGKEICNEAYANIFNVAKKNSGKTCVIFKMLVECADKNTVIVVFASTLYKDKNWIAIRKYFKKKKMEFRGYTDLFEEGVNNLTDLIDQLDAEAKEEEDDEIPEEMDQCDRLLALLGVGDDVPEEKEKKSKYLSPEYIIVFDDLSHQLKHPTIEALLKKNRHYRVKIIISSQWIHDLKPESRKQMDLMLVFKGMPPSKLQEVHKDADLSIPFDMFWKIYKKSTSKPYSFLYIDTRQQQLRRNFDTLIQVPQVQDE